MLLIFSPEGTSHALFTSLFYKDFCSVNWDFASLSTYLSAVDLQVHLPLIYESFKTQLIISDLT